MSLKIPRCFKSIPINCGFLNTFCCKFCNLFITLLAESDVQVCAKTRYRRISIHTLLAESDSNFDQILILLLCNILQNTLYSYKKFKLKCVFQKLHYHSFTIFPVRIPQPFYVYIRFAPDTIKLKLHLQQYQDPHLYVLLLPYNYCPDNKTSSCQRDHL